MHQDQRFVHALHGRRVAERADGWWRSAASRLLSKRRGVKGENVMQFRRSTVSRTCLQLFVLAMTGTGAWAQDFTAFDAAVVLKKSIWSNLAASILPLAKVELPKGKLSLVDAVLCPSTGNTTKVLVAFKEKDPKAYIVVTEPDCDKSAADLAQSKTEQVYDGLAYMAVTSENGHLHVATKEAALRQGARLSPGLLDDVRSYALTFNGQTINLGEGSLSDRIDLSANLVDGGLVVKAQESTVSHDLVDADVPTGFITSAPPGNTQIRISHSALSNIVATHLRDKELPINGTEAKFKIVSYSAAVDRVAIKAMITNAGLTFSGTATWTGTDLRLSSYSVESTKDCSSGSAIQKSLCNVARSAETVVAQSLAQVAWQKYQSSPLVPLMRSDKIKFDLYGQPAYFSGQSISASSLAKQLVMTVDSYVGVDR
jgi:hypothetical protein